MLTININDIIELKIQKFCNIKRIQLGEKIIVVIIFNEILMREALEIQLNKHFVNILSLSKTINDIKRFCYSMWLYFRDKNLLVRFSKSASRVLIKDKPTTIF